MIWEPIKGTKVIAFGHKCRQGKDTAANHLVQQYGALKLSFADALYTVARVMFNMREKDPALLQVLGTDVFRKMDPEVWVRTLYYKIKDSNAKLVTIADCRFPNEAQLIHDLGGTLVKVSRINSDGVQFISPDRDSAHYSETALNSFENWDYYLSIQEGDFGHLKRELNDIMYNIGIE